MTQLGKEGSGPLGLTSVSQIYILFVLLCRLEGKAGGDGGGAVVSRVQNRCVDPPAPMTLAAPTVT